MKTTPQSVPEAVKHSPLPYKTPWNVKYSVPSNPYVKHHIRSGNRVVALVNPTLSDVQDLTDESAPEGRKHAAFIIQACNSFEPLRDALTALLSSVVYESDREKARTLLDSLPK